MLALMMMLRGGGWRASVPRSMTHGAAPSLEPIATRPRPDVAMRAVYDAMVRAAVVRERGTAGAKGAVTMVMRGRVQCVTGDRSMTSPAERSHAPTCADATSQWHQSSDQTLGAM